jgi:hypothetical protein
MAQEDHWLLGLNFDVEERDAELRDAGDLPRAAFKAAIAEKPAAHFIIREALASPLPLAS